MKLYNNIENINFITKYDNKKNINIDKKIINTMNVIINNFLKLKNTDENNFKKYIIEIINKINLQNYYQCLNDLKLIKYINKNYFNTLSYEILIKGISDSVVIKKFNLPDNICSSEIYGDLIYDLKELKINDIYFIDIFIELCDNKFNDFITIKQFNENNKYRVNNFIGFLNFMGVLFNRKIINEEKFIFIFKNIIELIKNNTINLYEKKNIYTGYTKLINQILIKEEHKNKKYIDISRDALDKIISYVEIINNIDINKFINMQNKDILNRIIKLKL